MSFLSKVTKEAAPQPPRIVMYAAEKFGKSSFAAHSWSPIFAMTKGETGLLSLIEAGLVPSVPHFPEDFKAWGDLLTATRELRDAPHEYRTFVLDTGNGAELLCADTVCREEFGGNWAAYASYGRGTELATKEWTRFLALLDELRTKRRMAIIFLHHAKVKSFNNPTGDDWDQWRPEAIEKLWALTHKWADVILFGGFQVNLNKDGKAAGESRYLRAQASGAIVAGNRYGLPDVIRSSPGAASLWKAFETELRKARGKGQAKLAEQSEKAEPQPEGEYAGDHTLGVAG